MKVVGALALAVALVATGAFPASADELSDARSRADRVAEAFADAQTELAEVELRVSDLERQTAAAQAHLQQLESAVQDEAVRQYVDGGGLGVPVVFEEDINRSTRANALARFATDDVESSIDEYRAVREDFERASVELSDAQEEAQGAVATMERLRREAFAELERQIELDNRRKAEEARRAAAQARANALASRSTDSGGSGGSGGRVVLGSGNWICPVQGPRAFSNDWGMPRSGGRRHQGTDMLSPRGTPVVAPVAGTVTHRGNSLGGLSFHLTGDDGIRYYGTHLSRYGTGGRVEAGTVVGYVGDTGNARGTPHLHFEMHPGGGAAVNPYPTLRQYC